MMEERNKEDLLKTISVMCIAFETVYKIQAAMGVKFIVEDRIFLNLRLIKIQLELETTNWALIDALLEDNEKRAEQNAKK